VRALRGRAVLLGRCYILPTLPKRNHLQRRGQRVPDLPSWDIHPSRNGSMPGLPVPHVPRLSVCRVPTGMQAMPSRHLELVSGHTISALVLPMPGGDIRTEPPVPTLRSWPVLADPGYILSRLSYREVYAGLWRKRLPSLPSRNLLEPEFQHHLYAMPSRYFLNHPRRNRLPILPTGSILGAKHVLLFLLPSWHIQ